MYQLNIKISNIPKEDLIFFFEDVEFNEMLKLVSLMGKYANEIFNYEILWIDSK